ncbi:MAG: hypothetical protein GY940_20445, partial [bacterium]|nr:hypothetical protein [bacterium]
ESQTQGLTYTYNVSVSNIGKSVSVAAALDFSDNGSTVETISLPALQPGETSEHTVTWSGSGKAGSHQLVFDADKTGTVKEYSESNNQLTIDEEVPVVFYKLEVDPVIWPANSQMTIITRLVNNQETTASLTLDLSIANDGTGETIFQRTRIEEISAFGSKSVSDPFDTGVYPAGDYTLSQSLSADNVDLSETVSVRIETTKALNATLELLPASIPSDTAIDVELTMNLENTGNVPLEDETITMDVFHKESESVVKTVGFPFTLPLTGQTVEKKIVPLNLIEGNYEVRLKYLDEIVTTADLSAAGGLEKEKGINIRPRGLIMNLYPMASHSVEEEFMSGIFSSLGHEYEIGAKSQDGFIRLHKGHSNITVILGNLTGPTPWKELKERVWSGEGLIVWRYKAFNSDLWTDILGVKTKLIPSGDRETGVQLLASELNNAGDLQLPQVSTLQLTKERDDVQIIARTTVKQYPVMTYRKYGSGHIIVVSIPMAFQSGGSEVLQLFANAVSLFSKDVYTQSDLTRVLPVRFTLTNQTAESKLFTIKELLPYGVEGYDFNPLPLDPADPDSGDEFKWNLDIPSGGTLGLSYWLTLPDQIDSHDITTEVYDGDTKQDEITLTLEVGQTVLSRIDELVVEIDSVVAAGDDAVNLGKAKDHLQSLRNRGIDTDSLTKINANLDDAVKACYYFGLVENVDVSVLRSKTIAIMRIMGRKHSWPNTTS